MTTIETHSPTVPLERIYVWETNVRLTHWALFFSILVLSATGYYIGNPFASVPDPARAHFVMGWVRVVHLYAAIVFSAAVIARIYWAFAGNRYARWTDLVPVQMRRLRSFCKTFKFYSFIGREPDEYAGHNALAGSTYGAIFVVYLVMIATGLALYTVYVHVGSPFRAFTFLIPLFGGLPVARLIHHIGMWVILIFAVAHVYFVLLSSMVEHLGIFDSIFSGYKFRPQGDDDE